MAARSERYAVKRTGPDTVPVDQRVAARRRPQSSSTSVDHVAYTWDVATAASSFSDDS